MKKLVSIFILLTALSTTIHGQVTHMSARNMGMGGGGVAYMGDFQSIFINPANLLLNDRNTKFSFGFAGLALGVGGPFASVSDYNKYFTEGRIFDFAQSELFLDDVFGDGSELRSLNVGVDVAPFGMAFRMKKLGVGVAVRARSITDFGFNRGLANLGLRGFDIRSFSQAQAVDLNVKTVALTEVGVGLAYQLVDFSRVAIPWLNGTLSLGVTPKYLIGIGYYELNLESSLQINSTENLFIDQMTHDFTYSITTIGSAVDGMRDYIAGNQDDLFTAIEPDPADFGVNASGIGFDAGLTLTQDLSESPLFGGFGRGEKSLRLSLAITDIGNLNFSDNAATFTNDNIFVWQGLDINQERINAEFDSSLSDFIDYVRTDSIADGIYGQFVESTASPSFNLPTTMHVGASIVMNKFAMSMEFAKGFNDSGSSAGLLAMALGAEYRMFSFLPIRAGARFGGLVPATYTFGTGLSFKNFEFTFSTMYFDGVGGEGLFLGTAISGLVFRF